MENKKQSTTVRFTKVFAVALIFISCSKTPQEKIEDLIKNYVLENTNDASSYQSVSFGDLDSLFMDKNKKTFYGYKMKHKFRAKNAFGAVILNEMEFMIGEDFKINPPFLIEMEAEKEAQEKIEMESKMNALRDSILDAAGKSADSIITYEAKHK